MKLRTRSQLPLAFLALLFAGCAAFGPKLADYGVAGRAVELSTVPFYPQDDYESAPAAVATLLAAQQLPVNSDELLRQIKPDDDNEPYREGVIGAVRAQGLMPYVMHSPHLDLDVIREVQAGHPVMVLQNHGFSFAPRWQFAVVIGVDPANNSLILRAGRHPREIESFGAFLGSWGDGGHWAMVALKPEQLPATADVDNWIAAVAPFEQSGKADVAERAYAAATERWPDSAQAWESLANARHAQNNFRGASQALFTTLRLAPQNTVARNNLAYVLLERNCAEQAEDVIKQAMADETDPAKLAAFEQTRRKILKHDGPSVVCPMQ